jgi:hypothetical protein
MAEVFQGQGSAVKYYSIAGRTLSFSSAEEWSARMAETFLGGFYYRQEDGAGARQVNCALRILRGDPPPVPAGFSSYELPELGLLHTDGAEYHLEVNGSRVAAGGAAGAGVDIWLADGPVAKHPVAFANAISCAIQLALRRCGLAQLHSAGVVEPSSGAGVLIAGDSNSGKSSLTVRLARAGWSYLSDDMLLLHEAGQAVTARALRRVFAVSARSIAGCDLPRLEEALGPVVGSDPTKRSLDPSAAFPGRFAESSEPSVVVFPRVAGGDRTRVESLKRSDALLRFLRASPWACFDAEGKSYLKLLEKLVRQTRAYAVHAGRDLLEDAALAPRVFSDLVNALPR